MKRRETIESTIRSLLNSYRTSPFGNDHMVSVFMGNLDNLGVFKADVSKELFVKPEPPPPKGVVDLSRIDVYMDDDCQPYVYCNECEEPIIDNIDTSSMASVLADCVSHMDGYHS